VVAALHLYTVYDPIDEDEYGMPRKNQCHTQTHTKKQESCPPHHTFGLLLSFGVVVAAADRTKISLQRRGFVTDPSKEEADREATGKGRKQHTMNKVDMDAKCGVAPPPAGRKRRTLSSHQELAP